MPETEYILKIIKYPADFLAEIRKILPEDKIMWSYLSNGSVEPVGKRLRQHIELRAGELGPQLAGGNLQNGGTTKELMKLQELFHRWQNIVEAARNKI